jgi:hypothetical protein
MIFIINLLKYTLGLPLLLVSSFVLIIMILIDLSFFGLDYYWVNKLLNLWKLETLNWKENE